MTNDEKNQPENHAENQVGGFAAGLLVGGLAAATGVFLFGTKKGSKVTQDLKKTFQKVKEAVEQEVPTRGTSGEKAKQTFLNVIQDTLQYAADRFQARKDEEKPAHKAKKIKVVKTVKRGK